MGKIIPPITISVKPKDAEQTFNPVEALNKSGQDILDSDTEGENVLDVELTEDGNNTVISHVPPDIIEDSVPKEALEVIDAEGKDSEHFAFGI